MRRFQRVAGFDEDGIEKISTDCFKTTKSKYFTKEEQKMNAWVKQGHGLIASDWVIVVHKILQQTLGVKLKGVVPTYSLYRREKCFPFCHKIEITQEHPITENRIGQTLDASGIAFKVSTDRTILAEFDGREPAWSSLFDREECDAKYSKEHEFLKLLRCPKKKPPAIVVGSYGQGKTVYFSFEIDKSAYEAYSREDWVDIGKKTVLWGVV